MKRRKGILSCSVDDTEAFEPGAWRARSGVALVRRRGLRVAGVWRSAGQKSELSEMKDWLLKMKMPGIKAWLQTDITQHFGRNFNAEGLQIYKT